MPDTKLLPCPFCGESGVDYHSLSSCVLCPTCGAEGPYENEAIAAWNTRVLTPKQKAAEEMFDALKFVYEEGMKSEAIDCGDHCHSGCMWCAVRAALAKAGQPC